MSHVALIVRYDIKAEHRKAFEELIRDLAKRTLEAEKGCLRFDVLVPKDDRRHMYLYELYRDEDAYAEHTRSPRLPEVRERYKHMLDGREITICNC